MSFIVYDQGHHETHGPFNTEAEAQVWCDRANFHSPMKSEKWERHVMKLNQPTTLAPIPEGATKPY